MKTYGIAEIINFIDRVRRDPLLIYASRDEIRAWLSADEDEPLFDFVGGPGRYLIKKDTYADVRILDRTSMFGLPYFRIGIRLNGETKILTVPESQVL